MEVPNLTDCNKVSIVMYLTILSQSYLSSMYIHICIDRIHDSRFLRNETYKVEIF